MKKKTKKTLLPTSFKKNFFNGKWKCNKKKSGIQYGGGGGGGHKKLTLLLQIHYHNYTTTN